MSEVGQFRRANSGGDSAAFLGGKLYQNCTKKPSFWAFWRFCKQLKTLILLNLNN